jgi:hypothetical protein
VWKAEFEFAHQQVEPPQDPCQKLLRTVHRLHRSTNGHRSIHQSARLHRVYLSRSSSLLRIASFLTIFLHLNWDWSPHFSTLREKTAGFEPKRPEV